MVYVVQIDAILHKFYNHPSFLKISEKDKLTETFTFSKINETQTKIEILELNPRKSAGFDKIPSKIINNSVNSIVFPTHKFIQYISCREPFSVRSPIC